MALQLIAIFLPSLTLRFHSLVAFIAEKEGCTDPTAWRLCHLVGCGDLVAKSCLTVATPETVALQSPLSLEYSREEYWSGLPFRSRGDLPNPGIEPESPISCTAGRLLHCRWILYQLSHQGSPYAILLLPFFS